MLAGQGGGHSCQDITDRMVQRRDTYEESMALSVSRYPSYRVSGVLLLPDFCCPHIEKFPKSQGVVNIFRPWSVPIELGYA